MTWLGAGIGYRKVHRDALLAGGGPRVLEVMPDHFFADPSAIEPLAERYPIVVHDVGLSIATAGHDELRRTRVARIKQLAALARPVLVSDHLALTRSPSGIDVGHLAPIWRSEAQLAIVIDGVRALQDVLGLPIALENIAAPLELPGGMPEPEFFARLVDATGCGMLLDLTNLLFNARNQSFDVRARLREYPLEAVQQVHLAGGFVDASGVWIDSHSEPVESESYALLGELGRARTSVRTIVVERDDHLGDLAELTREADQAQRIWEGTA